MPPATTPSLICAEPQPAPGAQGIARIAVDDTHAQLVVTWLIPVALPAQAFLLDPRSYTLAGGQRRFPRVVRAEVIVPPSPPDAPSQQVRLTLDQLGDFSVYTLTVTGPNVDPFFASRKLRFRLACGDPFDCRPSGADVVPPSELPVTIDYLAKDYSSFRQALLDFIPTRIPAWTERSEADLGMMVLELLAATADGLSYLQDRVANEAFLGTATQRRSVAGHLALLGYQMDDGASAWTWLQFRVNTAHTLASAGFQVSTQPATDSEPVVVFETLTGATLDPRHNDMPLFTWGNARCCLPRDALSAVLVGRFDALRAGDHLLIEDDDGQRDVVRLIADAILVDQNTLVQWSAATPLQHEYCLTDVSTTPPTARTRVHGNLVVATHGETTSQTLQSPPSDPRATESTTVRRRRLALAAGPLAHLDARMPALGAPATPTGPSDAASAFTARASRGTSTLQIDVDGEAWQERTSLLESRSDDAVFRVELDDEGDATVVFGDGVFGRRLPESATVTARYRVGGGAAGNVGSNTLTRPLPQATPRPWLDAVTNPLGAVGGRDPESREQARRVGPATFQTPLVMVTAGDYQAAAQSFTDDAGRQPIQRATAAFRWTGSWLTVGLAADPRGAESLAPALGAALRDRLESGRLAGYDLAVSGAAYVSLDLALEFCVAPGGRASDVQQALEQALGNHDLGGGRRGFFHPDNFSFGDRLYVSALLAAVMAVPGVESAQVTRLARLRAAEPDRDTAANLRQGFLPVGPGEIVRLDNDRNFPERGTLDIRPRGTAA